MCKVLSLYLFYTITHCLLSIPAAALLVLFTASAGTGIISADFLPLAADCA